MNYRKMPSGYGIVQTAVMRLNISIQSKAIYFLLASYTGSKDYCFPKIETICNDMNLSKPMVIKYLKELEDNNLIKKSKLYVHSKRNNNKYEVMFIDEEDNNNNDGGNEEPFLPAENELNNDDLKVKSTLSSTDLTSLKVKHTLPPRLNTLNLPYRNNNSINNNSSSSVNNRPIININAGNKKPPDATVTTTDLKKLKEILADKIRLDPPQIHKYIDLKDNNPEYINYVKRLVQAVIYIINTDCTRIHKGNIAKYFLYLLKDSKKANELLNEFKEFRYNKMREKELKMIKDEALNREEEVKESEERFKYQYTYAFERYEALSISEKEEIKNTAYENAKKTTLKNNGDPVSSFQKLLLDARCKQEMQKIIFNKFPLTDNKYTGMQLNNITYKNYNKKTA